MVWFFERHEESLKLETRYDNDTAEFVAIVHYPDGREQTERFTKADKFRSWLVTFERNIEGQHWTRHGDGPVFLSDGWPDKPLT
jgi:hypothetical protein